MIGALSALPLSTAAFAQQGGARRRRLGFSRTARAREPPGDLATSRAACWRATWLAARLDSGGRRKGTPNKATTAASIQAEIAASGELPLDYMLRVMRDVTVDPPRRDAMARSAAQYCHPTLQAIAHKLVDADGNPISPVVNLSVSTPRLEDKTTKLTYVGAKKGDSVQ